MHTYSVSEIDYYIVVLQLANLIDSGFVLEFEQYSVGNWILIDKQQSKILFDTKNTVDLVESFVTIIGINNALDVYQHFLEIK